VLVFVVVQPPATLSADDRQHEAQSFLHPGRMRQELQAGDVIVRGAVTDEITDEVIDELTEEVTPAFTVSDLKRKYDDVLSITTVDWMDAGSEKVNHWEIGAV